MRDGNLAITNSLLLKLAVCYFSGMHMQAWLKITESLRILLGISAYQACTDRNSRCRLNRKGRVKSQSVSALLIVSRAQLNFFFK